MLREKLWESYDSPSKKEVSDEAVKKVEENIDLSKKLRNAHIIMDKIGVKDSEDNIIRKQLLKLEDKDLEALSKKSIEDIQTFLLNWRENETLETSKELNQENQKLNQDIQKIDSKYDEKDTKNQQEKQKLNQDIQKIKSVFTPQILEQNSTLSDLFQNLDNKSVEQKDKTLKDILKAQWKNPKIHHRATMMSR